MGTALANDAMAAFVKGNLRELLKDEDLGPAELQKLIAALAEGAKHDATLPDDAIDEDTKLLFEDFTCVGCHKFHELGKLGAAPDLTGYGSRQWIIGIISDPTQTRFYHDKNDRMPSYAKDPSDPAGNILSSRQVAILADWLRGKWYEPEEEAEIGD